MAADETIKKLAKLSPRERQVLGLVCSGIMLKDIAVQLSISLPTVKSDMGRVYVKLGLDQLNKAERRKTIYQLYCPLLEASALPTEPPPPEKAEPKPPEKNEPLPPEKDEPVPLSIMKMVEEDESEVVPPTRGEVIDVPITRQPGPNPRRSGRPPVGIIVLVVVFLGIGIVLLRDRLFPAQVSPQVVAATQAVAPENTAVVPPPRRNLCRR